MSLPTLTRPPTVASTSTYSLHPTHPSLLRVTTRFLITHGRMSKQHKLILKIYKSDFSWTGEIISSSYTVGRTLTTPFDDLRILYRVVICLRVHLYLLNSVCGLGHLFSDGLESEFTVNPVQYNLFSVLVFMWS